MNFKLHIILIFIYVKLVYYCRQTWRTKKISQVKSMFDLKPPYDISLGPGECTLCYGRCWLDLAQLPEMRGLRWKRDENIFLFLLGRRNFTLLNLSFFSVSRITVDKFPMFAENGKIIIKEILAVSSSGRGNKRE